jgi:hypothetical protein
MLSICFADDHRHEWWVSNKVFDRLFTSALENGHLEPAFEEWRHVANANGGLSFSADEQSVARQLIAGLRMAATAEMARLGNVDLHTDDGSYKVSLEKLLAATDAM